MSGQIITVAQQKGGAGKTTIAINLAVALSKRGTSVALLDTDPQGSMGGWFIDSISFGASVSMYRFSMGFTQIFETLRLHVVAGQPAIVIEFQPIIEIGLQT